MLNFDWWRFCSRVILLIYNKIELKVLNLKNMLSNLNKLKTQLTSNFFNKSIEESSFTLVLDESFIESSQSLSNEQFSDNEFNKEMKLFSGLAFRGNDESETS